MRSYGPKMKFRDARHRDEQEPNLGQLAPGSTETNVADDEPQCTCRSGFSRASDESVEHSPDCKLASKPGSSTQDRARLNTMRFVSASNRLRNRDAMPGENGGCNCSAGDDETGHDPSCPKYESARDEEPPSTAAEQARRNTDRFVRASDARHEANTAPRFRR